MKKILYFVIGFITGRYLLTVFDRLVSVLFLGDHEPSHIPFSDNNKRTYYSRFKDNVQTNYRRYRDND